ncbi:MAG TPA: DUF2768 domain-containing protein [Bacillales bacterium]|nr:DUF2768 domain-containing protein [Bacillales bacterium]
MSPGLIKMWISFVAIILFLIAIVLIVVSRNKLRGFWKALTATLAYICMIVAGLIVLLIIATGAPSH